MTVLFPFLPEAEVITPIRSRLAVLFAAFRAFETRFRRSGQFPGVLYLAPDPSAPTRALTEAMRQAFPVRPPYGGAVDGMVPHLTLSQGRELPSSELPNLRLSTRAQAVSHLALREGRWYEFARYPFAAPGARR